MRLSIRWRLTLWNTLALAAVLFTFGALVYGLLARAHDEIDRALEDRIDRSLRRVDQALLSEMQTLRRDRRMAVEGRRRLRYWIYEFEEHEKIFCVVYDPQGKVYERTEQLAGDSIPPAPSDPLTLPESPGDGDSGRVRGHGDSFFTEATLPIIGHQRLLTGRLRLGGKELTVVVMAGLEEVDREREDVARERREVNREFGQLLGVLFASVPAALALIAGLGYFLARKALAPVDQLRRLTEEISAERLHRRLPLANPGDELGRLTQTINAMIGRLERSFAEIRRFTADASHELRTPLTAIRTETEVALGKALGIADYQHLLGSILEECERLTRLTDQLLTLCREDAGKTPPAREAVDLTRLVDVVVETMRPLADVKRLQIDTAGNGPLRIQGDETRLRQVFYNLLDNAIKYTPAEGKIEIRLRKNDHAAVVSVRDTGIGIPPDHLPFVFERFYRVDKARSREQGGTGLGLSIAQSIVSAHGGNIELASAPGQGTTCTVTLPDK
jgi:two-component system heavy metal sensor histidine kinase CusS